jgi:hypothetical protein
LGDVLNICQDNASGRKTKNRFYDYLMYTQFKIFTQLIKEMRRNTIHDSELKDRSLYSRVSAWAPTVTDLA